MPETPMHAVLKRLHLDHAHALRVLRWMDTEFDLLEAGQHTDLCLIEDAMAYILDYADVFHHPNEDAIFERLQARDESLGDLLTELGNEHRELAAKGDALRVAAGGSDTSAIVTLGRAYTEALSRHMEVEEGAVLPLVDQIFDTADWAAVARGVVHTDDPLFGHRIESRFESLYGRLPEG
jgi:hemerythrin-like domain-containing protein